MAMANDGIPWGDAVPDAERTNLDFVAWDPLPVDRATTQRNADGSRADGGQRLGVDRRRRSRGFEGFAPRPYYAGYSANFFDGEHYVLKGASPRTARRLARPSFRNWFRAEYPYVYATVRLARS